MCDALGRIGPVCVCHGRIHTTFPAPPLRGRNDRMRVAKMSGKGVTFRATKSGPRIVKKKGVYLNFTRRFL